jgi:hypothetical protein
MARGKMARGLLGGLIVGILFGARLLFVWPAWAADPLKRLPDSPEIPDLYDPAIVGTYAVVAQRPYQVGGQPLATWLIATVLTPPNGPRRAILFRRFTGWFRWKPT